MNTLKLSKTLLLLCTAVLFSSSAEAQETWVIPTETEINNFSKQFSNAIANGKVQEVNNLISWDAVLKKSMRGAEAPKTSESFSQQFLTSINEGSSLAGELIRTVKSGGTYKALKVRSGKRYGLALFRLILPEQKGFNYHDFVIGKNAKGEVKVIDVYIYLSGELFSQTIRRSFLRAASEEDAKLAARLSSTEKEFVKHLDDVTAMTVAIQEGKFENCVEIFKKFPVELQKDKNLLILRFMASQNLSKEAFSEALADFAKHHPSDPCMNMLSVDALVVQEKYPEAIEAVNRLNRLVGGDGYLSLLKSRLYEASGKNDLAKEAALDAIRLEDTLLDAYLTVLGFSLYEEDHPRTLKILMAIDAKFTMNFSDLRTVPEYKNFVASSEFSKWETFLKSKKGEEKRTAQRPETKK